MPKAGIKPHGPQEVPEYTYPQGDDDGTWENISRNGELNASGVPGQYVCESSNGEGVFPLGPLGTQPATIIVIMQGTIPAGQRVTLKFKRPHGSTGAYVGCGVLLAGEAGPGRPFTMVNQAS